MANQLKVYLNVNEMFQKYVRKGKASYYLKVSLDGLNIGKVTKNHSFYIQNGGHNLTLTFCYKDDTHNEKYNCDFSCFISDDDFEVTVNMYFLNKVEFLEGHVPFDPEKAKAKGCYVATCVYGSYDCPQVWTLRRFRDDTLGATWYGRAFIHTYYAISPMLVKWFGKTTWFKKMWHGTLNRMVAKLNSQGVQDTPYQDKDW